MEKIILSYWAGLTENLPAAARPFFEAATLRHLPFLMLARVDGKSPAEYLTEEAERRHVREAAKEMIFHCPLTIEGLLPRLKKF